MNVTTSYAGAASTLAEMIAFDSDIRMDKTENAFDNDHDVSPVTLSSAWSRVARLLLFSSLAVGGSVGNVFMISAVVVEDHLKRRGNALLVNVALADLLVTGVIIPISVIIILAGQEGSLSTCRFAWTLEAVCFLVTVLTLLPIAVENYVRLCLPPERYERVTRTRVTSTILLAWMIAVMAVIHQSMLNVGPDFCRRKFRPIALEQIVGAVFLVLLPILIAIVLYARLVVRVRRATRGSYKPPVAFSWDYELTKSNIYSCTMFILFWLPYGLAVCVNSLRPGSMGAGVLYNLAWLALSKSCFNNLVYCATDRHFRTAYVKLFHYCCCKTTVSFSRRPRGDGIRGSGDVRLRVHIIHSYASPGPCRPAVARPNGRDVYEL